MDSYLQAIQNVFNVFLSDFYFKNVSYYDVANKMTTESDQEENYENFHHGFFLGLFTMIGADYLVDSNREYGLGRADIVVIPKDVRKPAYVFEFKWESTRGSKTLESLCEDALTQMEEKKYLEGVRQKHGNVEVIGLAVGTKGKEIEIRVH